MSRGHKELVDEVLLAGLHPDGAAAASALSAVSSGARALDVASVGDGHNHVLFLDQVFDADLGFGGDDLGATLVGVALADVFELHDDDIEQQLLAGEDGLQAPDLVAQLAVLDGQLLALEPGESGQAHLEDGARLPLRQVVLGALGSLDDLGLGASGAPHVLFQPLERQGHEARASLVGSG